MAESTKPTTAPAANNDNVIAALAYILFFIPLLTNKNEYTLFHANQGLNLFLMVVACNIVAIIPVLGWIAWMIGSLAALVFCIMGIVAALNGEKKQLPVIGQYKIIELK